MKIAYLDTIGGIAGDMTMAAFVSAGLPLETLAAAMRQLPVEGFELTARHVSRNAIAAVHIDVVVTREPHLHRDPISIGGLIDASSLSPAVKERARAILTVLAEAEARVHNLPVEKVHFHEIGALDSIIDIVGAAVCVEALGIERVFSSPVRLGRGGLVHTAHGPMPAPAPAALEVLRGYPVVLTGVEQELTTPTGAAIVKAFSSGLLEDQVIRVERVGYGAGTREFPQFPNLLRVVIGELDAERDLDDVTIVETNIDDMNPQVYPALIEQLLEAGAHDAYLTPIIMKKGRPGILLSVMTDSSRLDATVDLLYRQTSTIGLRIHTIGRKKLPRRSLEARTTLGTVRAKAVVRDGREVVAPEFEECRRIARETGRPLLEVMRQLERELAPGTEPRERTDP